MNSDINNKLMQVETRLEQLEYHYNGDNDTTCEGNYPQVTYTDEMLLTCILKQNEVIRMLVYEIDRLKEGIV
jgi:hypothetical protein